MQLTTSSLLTFLVVVGGISSSVSAIPRQQVAPRQAPPRGQIPQNVTKLLNQLPANAAEPLDFFPKDFGVQRGIPLGDGSARCQGANPSVAIDCSCPPDVDDPTFRAAVKIGLNMGFYPQPDVTMPIKIDEWNNNGQLGDKELQKKRNLVMVIAIQSLTGNKGLGCPGVSVPVLGGTG
ncbi:hypothetical protein QBC37DRAFT_45805 [Rhypophila decipiens]|uniref:Hydrophobin n=1 Tax=Rhypophila decipiens TaxID=261697 RepID=A0AAN7BDW1_9PEZI|nr:hypothetical protein QBC37DRAFT_45805 [Rhypophila decipiens]